MKLAVPSRLEDVRALAAALRAACVAKGVKPEDADALELSTTEAVNNVVKHAYRDDSVREVEVKLTVRANSAEVRVFDWGAPIPPDRLTDIPDELPFDPRDTASLTESGMGLFLIKKLVDEVRYESGGGLNCLTMLRMLRGA